MLAATIVEFAKVDRTAAALLMPYLGFTSFAAALTYTIWKDNVIEARRRRRPPFPASSCGPALLLAPHRC